jgi:hypothetical protein
VSRWRFGSVSSARWRSTRRASAGSSTIGVVVACRPPALAPLVDRQVRRHTHDPRRRVGAADDLGPVDARSRARLLGDVLRLLAVAEQPVRRSVGLRVQGRERRFEARGQPGAGLLLGHRPLHAHGLDPHGSFTSEARVRFTRADSLRG